ncbi:alkaline phosphatase family protein [Pontixanthobacter sp. CEM42]|uniref:alkaline phosphatase family protein n=1 Tax=Pontixanthobacter sp. CEM42 TaxID=2792077 RepID=UPI001AE0A79F|nr:alkaline phosphatase family protein [Pontixanthobacter sp. CEM42]
MRAAKTIFYELNEVPKRIFEHFAAMDGFDGLKRLQAHARKYVTVAEDTGHLSPWITWPTLHRGISNEEHEISDFGMDLSHVDREFPSIWRLLQRGGKKVGMFGSLHSYPLPEEVEDYAFYVPDTFAAGPECFPADFEAFQKFNLSMVQQNALNVNNKLPLLGAAEFLAKAPGLGLSGATVGKVAKQLASERVNKDRVVRRRTTQGQIAFDFFINAVRKNRPDAAFYFTNHVASSMHRYWPALFPQDYEQGRFAPEWSQQWGGEIPFAIKEADSQIRRLMDFCDKHSEYQLVVTSSMGQAAVDDRKPVNTAVTISSLSNLMSSLGLSDDEWSRRPSMAPQYNVLVADSARDRLKQKLGALNINGHHIVVDELGSGILRLELKAENLEALEVDFEGERIDPAAFGLKNLELQDAAGANAYHIPDGIMLIYDPAKLADNESFEEHRISTVEVAPSILKTFDIERPNYMASAQAF